MSKTLPVTPLALASTPSAAFVSRAADVAAFYGFDSIRQFSRDAHSFAESLTTCVAQLPQRAGAPVLAYYAAATPSPAPAELPLSAREAGEFGLLVLGSGESLGDVLLIKTVFAILREWGGQPMRTRINALGDKDSRARFERELSWYLRKRGPQLCEQCRARATGSALELYRCAQDECREILAEGPRTVNFLSERSRAHFRSLLEQLEALGLPYEIDSLLMEPAREARVLFSVDLAGGDEVVLQTAGGRWDDHIRALTGKSIPGASASIYFRRRGPARAHIAPASKPSAAPRFYFVQLGARAKLRGLFVLDALRQAGMPVGQTFDARGLSPQLETAKRLGSPYLIIMGEREALDGTVIVRRQADNAQATVPLAGLPRHLRTLRL